MTAVNFFFVLVWFIFVCDFRVKTDTSQCPPLPINKLQNGRIILLPDKRIRYICDKGYRLIGPSVIRCFNGRWSNKIEPLCTVPFSSCNPPEEILHGMTFGDEWTGGSKIYYICDQGYTLLGDRERTCEDGYWSSIAPTCHDESEPLKNVANRLKDQFFDKVGSYSSDSRARSIGADIKHTGLELLILIDRSSSIDPTDFKEGINFAKFLVNEFGVQNGVDPNSTGTRIAILTFGDKATFVVKLTDENIRSKEDAMMKLDSLQPEGGGTAMFDALSMLIGVLPSLRPKAKKAVFPLTDGHNNVGDIPPSEAAKHMKKVDGMEIFTVGIGRDINKTELISVASEPAITHVFLLQEYSDLSDIMWSIRNSPTAAPPMGPEKCGFLPDLKGNRVRVAVPDWPWLAVIYVKHPPKENHDKPRMGICSGSIICSQWVLTSASCFFGEDETAGDSKYLDAYVTLGENDLSRNDNTETNFRVSNVVLHPLFRPWSGSDYDIALVKLSHKAPLELSYRPVCLPTSVHKIQIQAGHNPSGNMAGWGTVPTPLFYEANFASSFSLFPQVTKLPFVEESKCNKLIANNSTNTFCAGSRFNPTCSGNLGSPIVVKHSPSNVHFISGVLSNKKFCHSRYNIFTEISRHVPWMNGVTGSCQKFH